MPEACLWAVFLSVAMFSLLSGTRKVGGEEVLSTVGSPSSKENPLVPLAGTLSVGALLGVIPIYGTNPPNTQGYLSTARGCACPPIGLVLF